MTIIIFTVGFVLKQRTFEDVKIDIILENIFLFFTNFDAFIIADVYLILVIHQISIVLYY